MVHVNRSSEIFNWEGRLTNFSAPAQKQAQLNSVFTANNDSDVVKNENGQIVERYEKDEDGQTIAHTWYEYDEEGRVKKESTDYMGGDGPYGWGLDGKPDSVNEYEYDENGRVIKDSCDTNGDGKPDSVREYEYDENGRVIKHSYDTNGDGKADIVWTYKYDEYDEKTRYESIDYDGDGVIDESGVDVFYKARKTIEYLDGLID